MKLIKHIRLWFYLAYSNYVIIKTFTKLFVISLVTMEDIEFINRPIAHEFLFWMFNLPRFINPIIYKWTDLIHFIVYYIICTLKDLIDYLNLLCS